MTRVSIFFQNQILICLNLWLYNRFQDLINVYLLVHPSVCITWHFIEIDLGLEIMYNRCPTMIPFLILLSWLVVLLNTILAITYTRLPNDIEPKCTSLLNRTLYQSFGCRYLSNITDTQFILSFTVFCLTQPRLHVIHL